MSARLRTFKMVIQITFRSVRKDTWQDVPQVEFELFCSGNGVSYMELSPTADTRTHLMASDLLLRVKRGIEEGAVVALLVINVMAHLYFPLLINDFSAYTP